MRRLASNISSISNRRELLRGRNYLLILLLNIRYARERSSILRILILLLNIRCTKER